jgi:hypothetical protein
MAYDPMYAIQGSELAKLRAVAKRLYSEMRMTADEMRDAAHTITAVVELAEQFDMEPRDSYSF